MRQTSAEANEAIQPASAVLRARVAEYVRVQGPDGATDEEIQLALGMNGNTQRPRRWELMNEGVLTDSGHVRLTRSHRSAVVWVFVVDEAERICLKAEFVEKERLIRQIKEELFSLPVQVARDVRQLIRSWGEKGAVVNVMTHCEAKGSP